MQSRHASKAALPLILASASPRRQELLARLGVDFEVWPAPTEEFHHEQFTAREVSVVNAQRKAQAVARRFPDHVVLGADTLVTLGTRLYGKPTDQVDAARMLRELAGQTHQVVTGVCLLRLAARRQCRFAETTDVTFRPLTGDEIQVYLAAVNALDKAGAYAIQERGDQLVARVDGSYSNVVGLPLERLRAELMKFAPELLPSGPRGHPRSPRQQPSI